ncbi:IclR family transcriptional regulator [Piscinibacter sakaiensis]|uniref:Transcriptional regulator, IclR family n=1 Tax=Piscinibacter sakaiensis TaxID=1547922 RepID=A0A0K8NVS9_PISS1|nr:IclR family transcriptional regulator [Piscinibacter sakaiensis]GAP34497.1 transcriptional regulator, IclR family [Piscinibacter sakaiensis]
MTPAPPELDRAQRAVQSVEVGGRLLLALAASAGPMSLKDLAAAAGLPPSRAHPYLVSFGKLRLIVQLPASGQYALGPAALRIGLAALGQVDALREATPVAEALAASTGLAVALAVWGNFGPTVVRMIDARQPLHVSMRAGTVMSLLGTATGRAFAAVLPRRALDLAMLAALGDLPDARPPPLQASEAELQAIAEEWRCHGVTRAVGRPIPGVNAFSAPAFTHEGEAALVVTALGHQDHVSPDWRSPVAEAVRAAAHEVSQRLGGEAIAAARRGHLPQPTAAPGGAGAAAEPAP